MKNINTKKVIAGAAALAVGASFLGAAVAAQVDFGSPVVKGDVIGTSGMPTATVIVGTAAQPADVIWAGNIAAAIASKAYTEETHTYEIPGTEGTEGTTTISGDGYLEDKYSLDWSLNPKTIDKDDYSGLYEKDVKIDDSIGVTAYDANQQSDELTISDTLTVRAKIKFDTDKDVKDLTATIDKGDILYDVDLDEGIAAGYLDSKASPALKFNIMGSEYTVDSYNGSKLTLLKNKASTTYEVNSTFSPEDGYTIEVVRILDNGNSDSPYEVELALKDGSGTTLKTDVFQDGDDVFDGELSANVEVDRVYASIVKIVVGSSAKIELENSKIVKDFPMKGDELWKAKFNVTDGFTSDATLTEIQLYTDDSDLAYKNEDALKIGDEISLPNDFAKIKFVGLTTEDSQEFEIADNVLTYKDYGEKSHELFLFDYDTGSDLDDFTTAKIDGHALFIDFNKTGKYFTIQLDDDKGKYLKVSGETWDRVSGTAGSNYQFDYNATGTTTFFSDIDIPLYNNETYKVKYTITTDADAADATVTQVAIGISAGSKEYAIGKTPYSWSVPRILTAPQSSADTNSTTAFIGYTADTTGITNVANTDLESVAAFNLIRNSVDVIETYYDAYTGDLVTITDSDSDSKISNEVLYDSNTSGAGTTYKLSSAGNDSDMEMGYTEYGALFSIEDGYFTATLPETQLYGQIFIGNGTVTTEGTEGTAGSTQTYTTYTPANIDAMNLVKMDTASVAGTKIVVGGHIVNTLAQGVTNDYLAQAGQWVMGKDTAGNIIVAGFTADDTGAATRAFIQAIQ